VFLTPQQIREFGDQLSRLPSRELGGETIEKILASVLPQAKQLPKDKKWFDIVQPSRGLEVKTFVVDTPLEAGRTIYNVLKRISKIESKDEGARLRAPQVVGDEIIDYLQGSIREHATLKRIPAERVMAILFRVTEATRFAYWEEPLDFGRKQDYRWTWNEAETLKGYRGTDEIFQWYSRNQKQFMYRWKVPTTADFIDVTPVATITLTEEELEERIERSYREGYEDAKTGKSKRL